MRPDKLKIHILEVILLLVLFFALFVLNNLTKIIVAVFLTIFMFITCKCIKSRKILSSEHKQVIILMSLAAIVYVGIYYALGLYFGYYDASVKFGLWSIFKFIIPLTLIIISSEVIRNVFIVQKTKFTNVSIFISMVLIDLIIYAEVYDITRLDDFLIVIGFILFASISCNLLYNYISIRFGYKPIIIYRLITVLYLYIIPITPDIYVFLSSFIRMIFPYIIYLVLEYTYAKTKMIIPYRNKKASIINTTILIVLMTLLIMLISCKFRYGILVIGSGSMTGSINKGDAVVFEKYDKQIVEKYDVLVFQKGDKRIVHRVVNIHKINNQLRYYTKGDANEKKDEGYITDTDILGISKFKIRYIGYPTIWLRDIFS